MCKRILQMQVQYMYCSDNNTVIRRRLNTNLSLISQISNMSWKMVQLNIDLLLISISFLEICLLFGFDVASFVLHQDFCPYFLLFFFFFFFFFLRSVVPNSLGLVPSPPAIDNTPAFLGIAASGDRFKFRDPTTLGATFGVW